MQTSFSELEYALKKKQTRRDRFLAEIEAVKPWVILAQTITPFYPSSGGRGRGRPPIGLGRMLRMYIAQQCFGLSDEGIEDALYDSQAIRRFVGIDLSRESAPDATTLLNFRHLLESHQLTESIFNAINGHLAAKGLLLREGTIVDATLIAAPPSTKNKAGQRDPEMHQSKKGKQWYFGMKAHIGIDAQSGLVHTVIGTAGNVSDVTQAQALLHGDETDAFGDSGYQGVEKRPESLELPVIWHDENLGNGDFDKGNAGPIGPFCASFCCVRALLPPQHSKQPPENCRGTNTRGIFTLAGLEADDLGCISNAATRSLRMIET